MRYAESVNEQNNMSNFVVHALCMGRGTTLIVLCTFFSVFSQSNSMYIPKQEDHYVGRVWQITPDQEITQWLPSLLPGDQLVLHEGIYEGSLLIDISGVKGFPIIIRGYGNGEDRPVFLYDGSTAQGVQITGDHLILDFIEFRSSDTYCVRIGMKGKGAKDVSIQNSVFNECGGGDISANYYDVPYDNIKILNNYFIGSKRTSVYIGNHQGTTLVTNFLSSRLNPVISPV